MAPNDQPLLNAGPIPPTLVWEVISVDSFLLKNQVSFCSYVKVCVNELIGGKLAISPGSFHF